VLLKHFCKYVICSGQLFVGSYHSFLKCVLTSVSSCNLSQILTSWTSCIPNYIYPSIKNVPE